jgi:hypothetical protein
MGEYIKPVIGNWYKDAEEEIFEVVTMDEEDNTIEVQYFGGEIDEIDLESWNLMQLRNVAAPEDWTGAYDDMEPDDLGYTDMNLRPDSVGFSVEDID